MEPRETHRCSAITAPAWRTVAGQDRGATRRYQAHPGADKVLLPGTKCRLYYRLVSRSGCNALSQEAWRLLARCKSSVLSISKYKAGSIVMGSSEFWVSTA